MTKTLFPVLSIALSGLLLAGGCGDDDEDDDTRGRGDERTGQACAVADDCYQDIDRTQLQGEVECMERVRDGYCTHSCESDADCCAVEGECKTALPQVCAPFESEPGMKCFLSCEGKGDAEQEFCQQEAGSDFICRASGGGDPRKVCVPGDCGIGASCDDVFVCDAGLECLTAFGGGYCGTQGCTTNAECGQNGLCVTHSNGTNYCLKSCAAPSDCSFCRPATETTECRSDVSFVEAGTTGSVCVPVLR